MLKDFQEDQGFTHWVDGEKTWSIGVRGLFVQLKSYIVVALITLFCSSSYPFWWPTSNPPQNISLNQSFIWHSTLITIALLFFIYWYTKKRTQRSLRIKSELHNLAHEARSTIYEINDEQVNTINDESQAIYNYRKHIKNFSQCACDIISDYFKDLTNDEHIGCAIRLEGSKPTEEGYIRKVYRTVARSKNLKKSRETTSEDIFADEGIPLVFHTKSVSCKGLLYYHNLKNAMANNAYKRTQNDYIYQGEIKYLIAGPINASYGDHEKLIGILYITSRNQSILNPRHIDLIKFSCDYLSLMYMNIFFLYHNIQVNRQ